jgi:3-oxoacyl-[acyl-carrier-protein] synthase II
MKVVITGIGCINALGQDIPSIWNKLCQGENGICSIPYWDTNAYKTSIAGCIKNFDKKKYFSKKEISKLDYSHQLAIAAAKEALEDAKLLNASFDRKSAGLFIGSSLAGMISGQKYHQAWANDKPRNPRHIHNYVMHSLLDQLSLATGFLGPRSLISTACTASTIAIAHAVEAIRLGHTEIILTGGVDPLCELSFAGFSSMKNVSSEACAPFSNPIGLTLGEGAAMLILESLDHALARGAKIYAELAGYALTADAYHPTSPDISAQGQKHLILKALDNSHTSIEKLGYINAHGTGTAGNDSIESKGIRLALQQHLDQILVSSSKGAIGHTLGAAGAMEALITTLVVNTNQIPPTANFKGARTACDLPHVTETKSKEITAAITQNFAFGGNNAALVIRKISSNKDIAKVKPLKRRIVITGIGLITPIGIGTENFTHGLNHNLSGISQQAEFSSTNKKYTAAIVKNFVPQNYSRADFRRIDRMGAFTICGIEMAIKHAGLHTQKDLLDGTGISIGTDCGPLESTMKFNEPIAKGEPQKVNPMLFPNTVLNAGAGLASIHLKLKGPNIALNVGEASGLNAISYAYDLIQSGHIDRMIAGGIDELSPFKLDAHEQAALLNKNNSIILGEGAAFFVMETLEAAEHRGANIYGEILGHYSCADNPVIRGWDPSGEGIIRSMKGALKHANLNSHDIDLISTGALNDPTHDDIESKSIKALFDKPLTISRFSSEMGLSAATAPMALAAYLLNKKHLEKTALINAFSQGGFNTALVIKKEQI